MPGKGWIKLDGMNVLNFDHFEAAKVMQVGNHFVVKFLTADGQKLHEHGQFATEVEAKAWLDGIMVMMGPTDLGWWKHPTLGWINLKLCSGVHLWQDTDPNTGELLDSWVVNLTAVEHGYPIFTGSQTDAQNYFNNFCGTTLGVLVTPPIPVIPPVPPPPIPVPPPPIPPAMP